jgi:hypothetical protein
VAARARAPAVAAVALAGLAALAWLAAPAAKGASDAVDCSLDDRRYAGGVGANTTLLAELQDELLWCLKGGRPLDGGRALELLGSFSLGAATGVRGLDDANPLLSNNLAVRSDLIQALVRRRMDASYEPDLGPVKAKLRTYGFPSNGYVTWYEGSGYLAYTLEAVRLASRAFGDAELGEFEEGSERWLCDLALPDGTLAPIGDTALDATYTFPRAPDRPADRVVRTDHETAVFFDGGRGYLLLRHPVNNSRPGGALRNDLHVPFDLGGVWLWYDGSWRLRPVGYPGYAIKTKEGLESRFDRNVQPADRLGGDFGQGDADRLDVLRYLGSWRATASVVILEGAVQRRESADRHELAFAYLLNTGEGGAYERYSRNLTLLKGQRRMEVADLNPGNASSYLMVSDDVELRSARAVSCGPDGRWSPGAGRVEPSRRCSVGGAEVLEYSVRWR